MKRLIIPVSLVTTLLCSCSSESKTLRQPSSSPQVAPSPARQPVGDPSADSDGGRNSLGDYVGFPKCGIKIRRPEGFEKADSFDGFGQSETQSSVMAASIPGPYSKVTAGFTQEQMKARGWVLRTRRDVKVDCLPGILVHFEQHAAGQVFLKWSLVFGDDRKTTMVTATSPMAAARELSARLKAAVLSTRLDRVSHVDPRADLPFTLAASPKLKLTPGINRTLAYTKDGVIPAKSPKDPLFIVAPSVGKVVTRDKQQFAERRLHQTAQTKRLAAKTTDAVNIDGLDGYESLANAEDAESGTPLFVYQVILFDSSSYVLMQGLVGTELRDEYLPEFKRMARSFQRKRP
jgi:hypothetical protein